MRLKRFRWLAVFLLLAQALAWPAAETKPDLRAAMDSLLSLREFREVAISPDGRRLAWVEQYSEIYVSDLGAPDSVNRVRHLRMNVGKTVRAPDGRESRILIRDTWNTDIVSELKPMPEDIVMYKTRFSGFYKTELDAALSRLAVRHLIITGCTTSICVESTVRDAMFRDYLPILLADCMSEPIGQSLSRSNHEASLLSTEVLLGWVSSSDQFIGAVSGSTANAHSHS